VGTFLGGENSLNDFIEPSKLALDLTFSGGLILVGCMVFDNGVEESIEAFEAKAELEPVSASGLSDSTFTGEVIFVVDKFLPYCWNVVEL